MNELIELVKEMVGINTDLMSLKESEEFEKDMIKKVIAWQKKKINEILPDITLTDNYEKFIDECWKRKNKHFAELDKFL